MYISSKFKCQLSFNSDLNLIEGCATQSWIVYLCFIHEVKKKESTNSVSSINC